MKIAIFSDNFYPEMSGISDSILSIAQGLAERNHRLQFYAPRYAVRDFRTANLTPEELTPHANITIIRLPSLPYPLAPTGQGRLVPPLFSSYRHIKKFDPDIICTQDCFGAGIEALLAAKLLGKPLIGTNHTPLTEFIRYSPARTDHFKLLLLKYVSWYYNRCAWTSAPSRSILNEMRQYGFKGVSQAVSNPIDLAAFKPVDQAGKAALKQKLGLSAQTVLYTGRLAEEKNVDVILRAIAAAKATLPDISLAVTGHGNAQAGLKKLSRELGLAKNVLFFGYVSEETLRQLYQAADIFTVMSTAESQCMSMMQAMAAGLPVIAANAWGMPEYVNSNNGYLLQPRDSSGLAEKIVHLFTDVETRNRLGQDACQHVRQFSQEGIVSQWEKIFRSHVNRDAQGLKLSLIIPAFNEEAFIGTCLESVLAQAKASPYDTEIIVVNNASTDRTREVALSYPGVKVVDEPRKGLPMARQAGFLASSGDLVANLDADGILPSGWIDKVMNEFSTHADLAALSGPYVYYDRPLSVNILTWLYYVMGYLLHTLKELLFGSWAMLQGGNYILRRSALEKIGGFDTRIEFYGEETDIANRIRKAGKIKFTFSLPMCTSGRRFEKEGLLATAGKYVMNHFWILLFQKPFRNAYTYVGGKDNPNEQLGTDSDNH